jgi:hypothetical protein
VTDVSHRDAQQIDEIDLIDFLHAMTGWANALFGRCTLGFTCAGLGGGRPERHGVAPLRWRVAHTFPVRTEARPIGALAAYLPKRSPELPGRDVEMMQAAVDMAAWGLVRRR